MSDKAVKIVVPFKRSLNIYSNYFKNVDMPSYFLRGMQPKDGMKKATRLRLYAIVWLFNLVRSTGVEPAAFRVGV